MDTPVPGTETQAPEWVSALGAEAAKDPEVIKYKTPDEFYKGYREKVTMLGKKGVIIPSPNDPPELHAKYREALGIPEKPEDYKFTAPEKLHPSIKVTPEFESNFKIRMHAKGLPSAAANALYNEFLTELSVAQTTLDTQNEKKRLDGMTKLNQEWGKDTETRLKRTGEVAKKVLGEEGFKDLGDFANNPAAVKLLDKFVSLTSEDAIQKLGMSKEQGQGDAKAQIDAMNRDPKHPLWNYDHPDHMKAVEERNKLYKQVYGGGK